MPPGGLCSAGPGTSDRGRVAKATSCSGEGAPEVTCRAAGAPHTPYLALLLQALRAEPCNAGLNSRETEAQGGESCLGL